MTTTNPGEHNSVRSDKSEAELALDVEANDIIIIIIIIIIIKGFSVYLHNSPGDITQFNNKSMQKTEKF